MSAFGAPSQIAGLSDFAHLATVRLVTLVYVVH